MLKNFTRPADEPVYYYSSSVDNGVVVKHEGDPAHAVYKSEMGEISRRANLWHAWVEKNVENAYNGWGVIDPDIIAKHHDINRQFMDGEREQ